MVHSFCATKLAKGRSCKALSRSTY